MDFDFDPHSSNLLEAIYPTVSAPFEKRLPISEAPIVPKVPKSAAIILLYFIF